MKAEELMTRKFEIVQADACVEDVARKLESSDLDVLPVCRDGYLVGLVTQGDLNARAAPWRRQRADATRVAEVIAPDVLYCFENTDVNEAAKLMRENRISRLPVLSRNKVVVGMLALKDIPGEGAAQRVQPAT